MKNHTWIVTYTTESNREITRVFKSAKDFNDFTDRLDKRIEKGTCGGYTGTRLG